MKNVLRIIAGLTGALFFLNGLNWIVYPASAAESLGMPLLNGLGLSTQIGDLGSLISNLMETDITIKSSIKRVRPENSEVERLVCDNSKLLKHTSWKPKYTIERGISEVIGWMKNPENLNMYKSGQYNV